MLIGTYRGRALAVWYNPMFRRSERQVQLKSHRLHFLHVTALCCQHLPLHELLRRTWGQTGLVLAPSSALRPSRHRRLSFIQLLIYFPTSKAVFGFPSVSNRNASRGTPSLAGWLAVPLRPHGHGRWGLPFISQHVRIGAGPRHRRGCAPL